MYNEAIIGFDLWWPVYLKAHVMNIARADDMIKHGLRGIHFIMKHYYC